jgi:hypothetical protein
MSLLRDFPHAFSEAFLPAGAPAIQLVADPVIVGHPFLAQHISSSIPGFPCGLSAVYQAHWINTGRLLTEPIPDPTPIAFLVQLFTQYIAKFPIYLFVNNPLAPANSTLVNILGPQRQDGWKILFIPAMPGLPIPHVALVRMPFVRVHPELAIPLVLFSSMPICHPNIYWHATVTSPLYYSRKALGLACLCTDICNHQPPNFVNALVVGFEHENITPKATIQAHLTVDHYTLPYSMTKDRGLRYTFVDGTYVEIPKCLFVRHDEDFITVPGSTLNLDFRIVYFPITGRKVFYPLVILAGVLFALYGVAPIFSVEFRVLVIVLTIFFLRFAVTSRVIRSVDPPPFVENWLPPSLQSMPFANDLANKLSTHNRSRAVVLSALRRALMSTRHEYLLQPSEVDAWLEHVCEEPAQVRCPAIPLGCCNLCFQKHNLKHCLCVECRRRPKLLCMSLTSTMVVGMLPLWTVDPMIPYDLPFRAGVQATYRGVPIRNTTDAMNIYILGQPPLKVWGRLAGPMYLGYIVNCFPRGIETTIVAFAVRLGIPAANQPNQALWIHFDYIRDFIFGGLSSSWPFNIDDVDYEFLEPWEPQDVIDHIKDSQKKTKMIKAYTEIDEGCRIERSKMSEFGAFAKLEKHVCTEFDPVEGVHIRKTKMAPRLINSPHPHVNAVLACYTLPLMKWLKRTCCHDSRLFYAGCSKPHEINHFFNNAVASNRFILEDDVSMMDGSQHEWSQRWQWRLIRILFDESDFDTILMPTMYRIVKVMIKQSGFMAFIDWINASGVPFTSFLNSTTTMVVRLYAVVCAYTGFTDVRSEGFRHHLGIIRRNIFMAVAGDDGLLFLPPDYGDVHTFSPLFMQRYIAAWADAGFDVGPAKIKTFTPANWRLCTFLAMRPVWSGSQYELGVEINRRLKTMFWILDKSIHPFSWGRGVATALLASSRHVPVVSDICLWYLDRTTGAVATIPQPQDISFTNPYSTVYNYSCEGDKNERGVREFLEDYHLTQDDYHSFITYLWNLDNVLVNLDHPVLRTIATFA